MRPQVRLQWLLGPDEKVPGLPHSCGDVGARTSGVSSNSNLRIEWIVVACPASCVLGLETIVGLEPPHTKRHPWGGGGSPPGGYLCNLPTEQSAPAPVQMR